MIRVKSHIIRIVIFIAGLLLISGVYVGYKRSVVSGFEITEGIVTRNLVHGINQSDFGSTISAEIKYYVGDSLMTISGPEGQPMEVGSFLPIIYNPNKPEQAYVNTFDGYWLHGWIWCLLPAIFWIAACFSLIEVRSTKPR